MIRRPRLRIFANDDVDDFPPLTKGQHVKVETQRHLSFWVHLVNEIEKNIFHGIICSRISLEESYHFGDIIRLHRNNVLAIATGGD